MDKQQIKSAILKATGNPQSGVIAEYVDVMVDEILKIDKKETKKFEPVKETRIIEPMNSRDINY